MLSTCFSFLSSLNHPKSTWLITLFLLWWTRGLRNALSTLIVATWLFYLKWGALAAFLFDIILRIFLRRQNYLFFFLDFHIDHLNLLLFKRLVKEWHSELFSFYLLSFHNLFVFLSQLSTSHCFNPRFIRDFVVHHLKEWIHCSVCPYHPFKEEFMLFLLMLLILG